MDFQPSKIKSMDSKPQRSQTQRIKADKINTTADNGKQRSGSPVEDTNNMFTKFAFPFKLHSILESAGTSGKESIISWLPSGKAFKIHKPKEFADVIMPQYFNQTKYRSFQRQLYIYGFDRVKDKSLDDYGAYFHELFIRGESDLCLDMQRQKIKGTGLSNEERRKKASIHRASSKPSSNERSMPKPSLTTSRQSPIPSVIQMPNLNHSLLGTLRMNLSNQLIVPNSVRSTPAEDWNSSSAAAVLKSAIQAQEYATRQDALTFSQSNSNSNGASARLAQFDMMSKIGRRCSLGFVRGGRRGSLLFDGDEVLFGNKKFFFTTEY
eukprot:CAMPEP_0197188580 /NCGR_PEP_ID=MMETSP1423-20130617/18046_1 /TAXON_ID=476441 /ORGANISM="Pseudo-nitzschia heimii, Strain UNC1101" /LENGTH=322 /DNA_ID=CAMNT_0042640449 /DNA_START=97 /DNA_END=1065 /DNA_ORIENTATION=+